MSRFQGCSWFSDFPKIHHDCYCYFYCYCRSCYCECCSDSDSRNFQVAAIKLIRIESERGLYRYLLSVGGPCRRTTYRADNTRAAWCYFGLCCGSVIIMNNWFDPSIQLCQDLTSFRRIIGKRATLETIAWLVLCHWRQADNLVICSVRYEDKGSYVVSYATSYNHPISSTADCFQFPTRSLFWSILSILPSVPLYIYACWLVRTALLTFNWLGWHSSHQTIRWLVPDLAVGWLTDWPQISPTCRLSPRPSINWRTQLLPHTRL